MAEVLLAVICIVFLFNLLIVFWMGRNHQKERDAWALERQMLLDRIMSVDYTEYKTIAHAKVRKKVEDIPPAPPLV